LHYAAPTGVTRQRSCAMRFQSRPPFYRLVVLIVVVLVAGDAWACCGSRDVCRCPKWPNERAYRAARWFVVETDNFRACSDESPSRAQSLARHAESLRKELRTKWLGDLREARWSPKCQILLHEELKKYVAAVGPGSERTVGSSLVKAERGQILSRRIDLLGGQSDFLSAGLPHELTHVVLKDRFVTTSIPRWADEGSAILADSTEKQGRHSADLRKALATGTAYPAVALLTLEDYPRPDRFGVFYGQSASLTEFLVKRKSPDAFVNFVGRAAVVGYDSALKTCYGIANVRELDRQWRESHPSVQLSLSSRDRSAPPFWRFR
jgi:hypothetical protein